MFEYINQYTMHDHSHKWRNCGFKSDVQIFKETEIQKVESFQNIPYPEEWLDSPKEGEVPPHSGAGCWELSQTLSMKIFLDKDNKHIEKNIKHR